MALKLEIIGNKSFASAFANKAKEARLILEEEIAALVFETQNMAAQKAPRRFSNLANSITAEANGLNGAVTVGVRYAPYIEFGTGGLVDVPAGLEDYAMQFKGKGIAQINITPRPFLFNSFFYQRQIFVDTMNERLSKLINNN